MPRTNLNQTTTRTRTRRAVRPAGALALVALSASVAACDRGSTAAAEQAPVTVTPPAGTTSDRPEVTTAAATDTSGPSDPAPTGTTNTPGPQTGTSTDTTGDNPTPTGSSEPSGTSVPTGNGDGGATDGPAPRCTGDQVAVFASRTPGGGGAGHYTVQLRATNTSDRECLLMGWPGVSMTEPGTGRQLGAPATRTGDAPTAVLLKPNRQNNGILDLRVAQAGTSCSPVSAAGLRVYLPEDTRALFAPVRLQACADSKVSLMQVEPFERST